MITILYIMLLFAGGLSLFRMKVEPVRNILYLAMALLLIIMAAFRPEDVGKDYIVYVYYWNVKFLKDVEISFIHIRDILKYGLMLQSSSLFVVYAILGVSAKLWGIRLLTPHLFLALMMYISHYYILHELTQIRVGVASGIFLISLYYLAQRNFKIYLMLVLLAGYFHYSAFLALPLWFIYNDQRKIKVYLFLIPLGYLAYFTGSDLIVNIPIPYIQEKIQIYQKLRDMGFEDTDKINVFNAVFLVRILMFYVLYIFRERVSQHNDKLFLLWKIYGISLFAFTALASIPAFAFRIQELLGVVEIILFASLAYIFKARFFGYGMVIIIALILMSVNIFYGKLILY